MKQVHKLSVCLIFTNKHNMHIDESRLLYLESLTKFIPYVITLKSLKHLKDHISLEQLS